MAKDVISAMQDYIKQASKYGDIAISVIKTTIDKESEQVYDKIRDGVSVYSGLLQSSLKINAVRKGSSTHGYKIEFDGYDTQGRSYQMIANTLNKGRDPGVSKSGNSYGAIVGTHFIDVAVNGLKGLDKRINDNINNAINKESK